MANQTLHFIVDADVARSAGLSEHPVSSGSRYLLESISKKGHKAAMCPKLLQEWKQHKSLFSKRWLASMIAKKKIAFINPNAKIKIFIEENVSEGKDKDIALKDSHLIDAALETDKIITSNDSTAKAVFCTLSKKNGEISQISWFNAVTDKDFISDTLMSNGQIPSKYFLQSES